jgi:hypothetical protein
LTVASFVSRRSFGTMTFPDLSLSTKFLFLVPSAGGGFGTYNKIDKVNLKENIIPEIVDEIVAQWEWGKWKEREEGMNTIRGLGASSAHPNLGCLKLVEVQRPLLVPSFHGFD